MRVSNQGLTLVETMIAMVLLSMTAVGVFSGVNLFSRHVKTEVQRTTKDQIIRNLIEDMMPNILQYQVTYDSGGLSRDGTVTRQSPSSSPYPKAYPSASPSSSAANVALEKDFLKYNKLPLAWDNGVPAVEISKCPACRGRIGFVIVPAGDGYSFRGLYEVVFRITHSELIGPCSNDSCKTEDLRVVMGERQ